MNEVIKTILDFFIQKFHTHKSTKHLERTKIKNAHKKHLRGKVHLFAYLRFCDFTWLSLCTFSAFVACGVLSWFEIALMTSFTLLLIQQYIKYCFHEQCKYTALARLTCNSKDF